MSETLMDERLRLGIAFDLTRGRGAIRSDDSLERVLAIEPVSAVHDWRARQRIAVIDKHAFAPDLRHRLAQSDAQWTFPPAASFYVPPREVPGDG